MKHKANNSGCAQVAIAFLIIPQAMLLLAIAGQGIVDFLTWVMEPGTEDVQEERKPSMTQEPQEAEPVAPWLKPDISTVTDSSTRVTFAEAGELIKRYDFVHRPLNWSLYVLVPKDGSLTLGQLASLYALDTLYVYEDTGAVKSIFDLTGDPDDGLAGERRAGFMAQKIVEINASTWVKNGFFRSGRDATRQTNADDILEYALPAKFEYVRVPNLITFGLKSRGIAVKRPQAPT